MAKTYPVSKEKPEAIVVRCPDRRFRIAHQRFIQEELGLTGSKYVPIKMAGGAGPLARQKDMPHDYASLFFQLRFFVRHYPSIRQIVLINHEDCGRYSWIIDRKTSPADPEKQDLIPAAKMLSRQFPRIQIFAYFARFADESREKIFFEAVREPVLTEV